MNKRLWYTALSANYSSSEERRYMDDIGNFSIDINYISFLDKGYDDPECRKKLIGFLGDKGCWKKIENEWENICSLMKPEKAVFNEDLISKLKHDTVFRFKERIYHFNFAQGLLLDLEDSYMLQPNEFIDRDYFDYFFAYRLSKRDLNQLQGFLSFNFHYHFNQDVHQYTAFIRDVILKKHHDLIGKDRFDLISSIFKEDSPATNSINYDNISPTIIAYIIWFRELADSSVNKQELYKFYQKEHRPNDEGWSSTIKTTYNRLVKRKKLPAKHKDAVEMALLLIGNNNPKAKLEGQKMLKSFR